MNDILLIYSDISEENRFTKLTAIHRSEKREMKESNGLWGPVEWKNSYSISAHGSYFTLYPNFQLILEYRPKPTVRVATKLAHLSNILDTQQNADVQFVVKGRNIGAHYVIVTSASPVMSAMLCPGKFKEGSLKVVVIDDMEPEVFMEMLRFMYTGVAPSILRFLEDLFVAADKYQISALKEECEQLMGYRLTVENVIRRLELAHKHSASTLLETALDYLILHQDEIWNRTEWKEMGKKNYDVFFLATQRMYCKENRKRKAEDGSPKNSPDVKAVPSRPTTMAHVNPPDFASMFALSQVARLTMP